MVKVSCLNKMYGLMMRSFAWNRFPIKICDWSWLISPVEWSYLNKSFCDHFMRGFYHKSSATTSPRS